MQSDKNTVYLLLGSNLGNRETYIDDAVSLLGSRVGEILKTSSIYETAAWGKTDQPSFLNLALEIDTVQSPLELLKTIQEIEADLGRIRYEKWGARLIDIDIILFAEEVVDVEGHLQIPHPEMQNRKFVLLPMAEIAPNVIHPLLKQTIESLLLNLDDDLSVLKRS